MFKKSLNLNDAWFGFYSHFKRGTLHVHMNYFKISRQKYSTNMATGRRVTSRENDLYIRNQFPLAILMLFWEYNRVGTHCMFPPPLEHLFLVKWTFIWMSMQDIHVTSTRLSSFPLPDSININGFFPFPDNMAK